MGKQKFLFFRGFVFVAWSVVAVTVWPNVALSALDRNDAFIGYTEGASSSLSRDHHPAQEESLLGRQNGEENIQDDFVKRLGKIREKQLGFLKPCENAHKDALECIGWAKNGECSKNAHFMLANCRKACERCEDVFVRAASERHDFVNVYFDMTVDGHGNFLRRRDDDNNDDDDDDDGEGVTHPPNRVILELYNNTHPKTSENFRKLISNNNENAGDTHIGKYKRAKFHRIIPGFMNQAGSATKSGSIYGRKFDDENINSRHHDQPYLLAMANGGPNTNGDQFYITVNPQPHLDGKHVVFGRVIRGERAVEFVNQKCGSENGRPKCDVQIARCGEML